MLTISHFGTQPYALIWQAMQARQSTNEGRSLDSIWLGEHPAVYTLGQAADPKHLHSPPTSIPVVRTDRGGQVTYHGPGQLMFYTLLNLKRLGWGIRRLVIELEQTLIDYLAQNHIQAHGDRDAPGVYINEQKVAAVGLRVKHGCTYHGMAINVNMDLTPFQGIHPCGYQQLSVTQLKDHHLLIDPLTLGMALGSILANKMGADAVRKPWSPTKST